MKGISPEINVNKKNGKKSYLALNLSLNPFLNRIKDPNIKATYLKIDMSNIVNWNINKKVEIIPNQNS